jgi:hypothetical protein
MSEIARAARHCHSFSEAAVYIHLGNDVSVRTGDIIGIFDMDRATVSRDTQAFLRRCEDEDMVTNVSQDLPKSFVLCRCNGRLQVFISAISPATLKRRGMFRRNYGI